MTFVFGQRLRTNSLLKGSVRLTVDQCAPPGVDHTGPFRQWSEHLLAMLQQARDQGELLPTVQPPDTADLLVGAFAGVQLMSRALHGREDLGHRISVMWAHLLPSIAVPGLLIGLDSRPDRGVRVLASVESGELVGAEA